MSAPNELWALPATKVVALLKTRELSALDLLDSLEARISAVNPLVNALPTLCFERARSQARALEQDKGAVLPLLAGLPVAIKDSIRTAGVRTTFGSKVFRDHVPEVSDAVVTTIEGHGGIVYAKSNTPEFEAGANTFNEVFGRSCNPWNTAWSAGGSSGGAAIAVATGMAWVAQGTDFACSLRNPASFCGVVGLRPGLGLVPQGPSAAPFQTLSVSGPIARSTADCGLFLDAMAGQSAQDPYAARALLPGGFQAAAEAPLAPKRLAFSLDLGITPVAPEVTACFHAALSQIEAAGAPLHEVHPDMGAAHQAFRTLRALQFAQTWGHLLPAETAQIKPEVVWNIEEGMALAAPAILSAERARAAIRATLLEVLQHHDFLVLPSSIVPPFPIENRYVEHCAGHKFSNYLEWMAIAYAITLTGFPAISIPAGRTDQGKPVGLQIVARPGAEAGLLSCAAWIEACLGQALSRPIDPVLAPAA